MTKRTIEIEDVLPDCVANATAEVDALCRKYLADNPDADEVPNLWNDLNYSGGVHEIVDGAVPIMTRDIEAAWFLHGRELEAAYENAGVGDNPRENNGMAAIYYYIEQEVNEWWCDNAQRIFDESRKGGAR